MLSTYERLIHASAELNHKLNSGFTQIKDRDDFLVIQNSKFKIYCKKRNHIILVINKSVNTSESEKVLNILKKFFNNNEISFEEVEKF